MSSDTRHLHRVDVGLRRDGVSGMGTSEPAGSFGVAVLIANRAVKRLGVGDVVVVTPVLAEIPSLPGNAILGESITFPHGTTEADVKERIRELFTRFGKELR